MRCIGSRMGQFVPFLIVGIFFWPHSVRAQNDGPCDHEISPRTGTLAYRQRGNRCEGFYSTPFAGGFQVVSLLQGDVDFPLQKDVILTVSVATTRSFKDLHVRAVAIPLGTLYRMDALLSTNAGPLRWNVGDVLEPAGIHSSELGAFGFERAENSQTFYVPLRIGWRKEELHNRGKIFLKMRGTITVEQLFQRWSRFESGHCGSPSNWERVSIKSVPYGQPITLPLAAEMTGDICLYLSAKPQGSDQKMSTEIRLRL